MKKKKENFGCLGTPSTVPLRYMYLLKLSVQEPSSPPALRKLPPFRPHGRSPPQDFKSCPLRGRHCVGNFVER